MSAQDPNSLLTTEELLVLSNFRRGTADNLDLAISEMPDISIVAGTGLTGGGDLSTTRTLALANTAVTPAAYTSANITVDQQGRITAAANGSSTGFAVISVKQAPYSAVGDGVADDTVAIQAALTAAAASLVPVYFPPGTYKVTHAGGSDVGSSWCLLFSTDGLRLIGDRATIVYASTTDNAIRLTGSAAHVRVEGLRFQGDSDDVFAENTGAALYFLGTVKDVTIRDCEFSHSGIPIFFASDGTVPGRVIIDSSRFLNCPNSINTPYRSIITNNIFDCDSKPGTRSHMVYIFGAADGCVITGNVFRNSDSTAGTYAIQIRTSGPRYGTKSGYVIANNMFYNCTGGMWIGSDEAANVGGVSVTGNSFFNCALCVEGYGLRGSTISSNTVEVSWEMGTSGSAAISANSGDSAYPAQLAHADSVQITGNTIINLHPWFGIVDVTTLPTAGHTVTVGTQTYTWRASASTTGDVTIGASTTAATQNLQAALRGDAHNAPNHVLRDGQDAMVSPFVYDASVTNRLVIASHYTFALSQSNSELTLTAAAEHRAYAGGIESQRSFWVQIDSNTIKDLVPGISILNSMAPTINRNNLAGSSIRGLSNVFSSYRGNRFADTPYHDSFNYRPDRYMVITDGFYVEDDNGLASVVPSQQRDVTGGGVCGLIPVGAGFSKCRLFYGTESFAAGTPTANSSFPFRWADGDKVTLSNDAASFGENYYFKRASPGAGEFNTADGLIALINAGGHCTAAYVPFADTGGDSDPKLMIEITYGTIGTAGNTVYLAVVPAATEGADQRSIRTVGVIPLNRENSVTNYCYFKGGAAAATTTVMWSPIASTARGASVSGVDATSQALAPVVYAADITPGVGLVVTHTAAAGTENFFVKVH